mmetsp:Transcript_10200/g.26375  ORF Transcript_10200/g.26375 Transcript_10200/m.26375 type:complete len:255 (-) Transcript_10200:202-966(-)
MASDERPSAFSVRSSTSSVFDAATAAASARTPSRTLPQDPISWQPAASSRTSMGWAARSRARRVAPSWPSGLPDRSRWRTFVRGSPTAAVSARRTAFPEAAPIRFPRRLNFWSEGWARKPAARERRPAGSVPPAEHACVWFSLSERRLVACGSARPMAAAPRTPRSLPLTSSDCSPELCRISQPIGSAASVLSLALEISTRRACRQLERSTRAIIAKCTSQGARFRHSSRMMLATAMGRTGRPTRPPVRTSAAA